MQGGQSQSALSGSERRIVNVAAAVNLTDAVNLGQLNAAVASVSGVTPGGPIKLGNSALRLSGLLSLSSPSLAVESGGLLLGSEGQFDFGGGQFSMTDPALLITDSQIAFGGDANFGGGQIQLPGPGFVLSGGQLVIGEGGSSNQTTGNSGRGISLTPLGVAIGNNSSIFQKAVAIGFGNRASGNGAVAIGDPNNATGTGAVAMGADNTATGDGSVALGSQSVANGQSAIALGNKANASAAGAIALGENARATAAKSVAIGADASASRANQVVLGGAGSSVTVGDVAASTAAQTGPTDVVTVDASGTLGRDPSVRQAIAANSSAIASQATAINALQALDVQQNSRLTSLEGLVGNLNQRVDANNRAANGGIAAAMALGGTILPADAKMSMSFNLSTYRGQQGFSGQIVTKAGSHVYINAGVAGSTVKGSTGGRVGMTFAW
jgi:autotransporter adhesin